jgi:hypothetical protein
MTDSKAIETALVNVVKAGIFHNYKKSSKLMQDYKGYRAELKNADDKEIHIRRIACMIFPDEEAYTQKMARYRRWYANKKRLLKAIEELYELYYNLAKEEMLTEEQIENEAEDFLNSEE